MIPIPADPFLQRGGEVGERIRAVDWTATVLGPPDSWPPELVTAVRIILASQQPMVVWWGPDYIQIYNDAYSPLLGARHPVALGQPAAETWASAWHQIGPQAELAARGLGDTLPLILERHSESRDRRYRFTATVIGDRAGPGILMIGSPIDPSDQRRIERALRFQAQVMSEVADAVVAIDNDNRITFFNSAAERLYGVPAREAIGQRREDVYQVRWLAPGDQARSFEAVRKFGVWRGENIHLRQNGTELPVEAVVTLTRDEVGQTTGMLAVLRDMTKHKQVAANLFESEGRFRQIAEELRQADRRKDQFLATLAHELRNPLAPIRNGLAILQHERTDEQAAERALAMMERQLHHLVRLVDDLLDVSRIQRGKIELRRSTILLADVVQNAVEAVRAAISDRRHILEVRVPTEPLPVDGDLTRLAQVLSNLLNNAAKFTPEGGRISLEVTGVETDIVVIVADNGVGIAADKLPSIFDIFTQVEESRGSGGLGIGLSIVKELVHMHGGTVSARSAGTNQGAIFTIRLPRATASATLSAPSAPTAEDAAPARTAVRRVLLADDNVDSAASLATILSLVGNEVQTAHDGLELLELVDQFRPQVVLLDIGMPRVDGYEACRRLRAKPWGAAVTLIALTGWGHEEAKRLSREAGFDHHLVKPVDPAALIDLISAVEPRII